MNDRPGFPPPPPSTEPVPAGPGTSPAPVAPKRSLRTPIIVALVVVVAIGAYFAVTTTTDKVPPTVEEVSAAFVPLAGFEYAEMPAEALEPLRQAFASDSASEYIAHFDARQVTASGTPEAVVFILSVDPDEMKGDFEEEYVQGFTESSQATVQDLTIGDITGHIAETPLGTVAFFFDADGFAFNIVGRDTPTVESIARALAAGNS